MIQRLRSNRWFKHFVIFILVCIIPQLIIPPSAFALTGGPSQPEVQSFEPVGTSDMVNLFSGDFTYNIPLFDVGGYPVNLSYNSGITMDQEASWVGLGWNVNPGVINRGMRGMPDDFKGDRIIKEMNIKPNTTIGASLALGQIEMAGMPKLLKGGVNFGIFYNNYKGVGYEFGVNPTIAIANKGKANLNLDLGLSSNSQQGINIEPTLGLSSEATKLEKDASGATVFNLKAGASYNTTTGLKSLTFGASADFHTFKSDGTTINNNAAATFPLGSSTIPTNLQTYIPQISMPMTSISTSFNVGIGVEYTWIHANATLNGYFNSQKLMFPRQKLRAFGYLYAEHGQHTPTAVHDFNREKDGSFTKSTPALPLASYTYDVFNASGQGVSGMYRPYRSDVGTIYDNRTVSLSDGMQLGIDAGAGQLGKGGMNGGFNFSFSTSGKWNGGHDLTKGLSFIKKSSVHKSFRSRHEPFYFKRAGELGVNDIRFQSTYGGIDPVRYSISSDGETHSFLKRDRLINGKSFPFGLMESDIAVPPNNIKTSREKRNQVFSFHTVGEAKKYAVDKKIKSCFYDASGNYQESFYERDEFAPGHHISEISILRTDGARYIYGIPAYNRSQKEVTFNTVGQSQDCTNGLTHYDPDGNNDGKKDDGDDSIKNENGIDNFYSSTELPPYAHSYLLTSVLSTDYVDRTQDGTTDDDFGSYTNFGYSRYQDLNKKHDLYKWRSPYHEDQANFNEGLKEDKQDDKGSYVYGEKELWYLNHIETKTHRAAFYISSREDGLGVTDRHGGKDNDMVVYKLDSIKLFVKCDKSKPDGVDKAIKTVHFDYINTLCPNVKNNLKSNGGKLTLEKVYFTYGASLKGKLSPYKFGYGAFTDSQGHEVTVNPPYRPKDYDRWGYYKRNLATDCDPNSQPLSNAEFPYVIQDKDLADYNATAWNLTSIELPSGGVINVDYESDDYGYVQDKRAMQMVTIAGLGEDSTSMTSDELFSITQEKVYLRLALPQPVKDADELRKKYLEDENGTIQRTIYFKFLTDVIGRAGGITPNHDAYEYVPGYAEIEDYGVNKNGHAWLKLKKAPIGDREKLTLKVHPIAKTAWQFARLYLHKKVMPGSDPKGNDESALRSLLGYLTELTRLFFGYNLMLRSWSFGKRVKLSKSMVRLYTPEFKKLGGGCRVKRLTIGDRWGDMTQHGRSFEYGQEYTYTTIKDGSITATNPDGIEISSGVAEYEPMIGNEENPWRQPDAYSDEHRLAPDNHFYKELPYGESLFPAANVGYSKVQVRNLKRDGVKRHATGHVEHYFYTAKDYPVATRQTRLERLPKKPSWLRKILKVDIKDYMTASQGFAIYLNDMHGKPKSQWVYPEVPPDTRSDVIKPVSGVEYRYRTHQNYPKRLNNELLTIDPNGVSSMKTVGQEIDLINDMRENTTTASGLTFSTNIDLSLFPSPLPFPLPIFSGWPKYTSEETRFRSTVITKVVTQYGILEKTIAHDLGSRVETENLAFDSKTGEVLLTKTANDFNDPIYSFTYPAHWAYKGMGMAYENLGVSFSGVIFRSGVASLANAHSYFSEGDELAFSTPGLTDKFWVIRVTNNELEVVDKNGRKPTTTQTVPVSTQTGILKIVRSGKRNMQSVPVGTVTSKKNPITTGLNSLSSSTDIINTGAIEFSDDWETFCECGIDLNPGHKSINPYLLGSKGSWRSKKSWLYLTDRTQARLNRSTNIREDGVFSHFDPFWLNNGNYTWDPTPNTGSLQDTWTYTSEVTLFSPFGFELENRDALKRYSAAVYGFDNTLPIAVASNAKYKEIGFDSFEDYDCKTCVDDHFSFSNSEPVAKITDQEAHSGRKSIKLGPRQNVKITKFLIACPGEEAKVEQGIRATVPTGVLDHTIKNRN